MGSSLLIGNASSFGIPAWHRKAIAIVVVGSLVSIALLVSFTRAESRTTPAIYRDRLAARVDRSEPCASDSEEAVIGLNQALQCHRVLVEALEGPDTGQLLALAPLYVKRGSSDSSPFVDNQLIYIRGLAGPSSTTYHFVGQPRSASLFLVLTILGAVVLVTGHRRGIQLLFLSAATLIVLTWHTVPALVGLDATTSGVELTVLASALSILTVAYFLEGPLRVSTQLSFLASGVSVGLAIGLGILLTTVVGSNDPVSAEVLLLNPLGADSNLEGFVLLGLVVAVVFAIGRSTKAHIDAALGYERYLESAATEPVTRSTVFFATLTRCRADAASGVGIFLFASFSGAIPLLMLFGADGVQASQALNNELLAATVVRISAGAIALALVGPIATGIACFAISHQSPIDRSGEIHEPRPTVRRETLTGDEVAIELEPTVDLVDQPFTSRLRVGVEE